MAESWPQIPYSDLLAGRVLAHRPDARRLDLLVDDGSRVALRYSPDAEVRGLRNLGAPPVHPSGPRGELITPDTRLFAYGVRYPDGEFEAHQLTVAGREGARHAFEEPSWWPQQLGEIARFYRRAQFGTGEVDFRDYRTVLRLGGDKSDHFVQETDTLSRLVYAMASAHLLTGDEDLLDVAEKGVEYLREHMRFADRDEDVVYWYHGIDVRDGRESKLFSSAFGDDYAAVPAYEQIYALVGLTQTYRVTGDPRIRADIDATLRLFERFFRDPAGGGWYSHVDPLRFDPHHPGLGANRSRKNWNSIGDHAPAYLFNLYLATGAPEHAAMLEHAFAMVLEHFPSQDSPFVQERFHDDWSADRSWGWQQDRAVVGHNLKIAWNLLRMNAIRPDPAYRALAERIGATMPAVGADLQRGGWYDVVDRPARAAGGHRLTWHDRKAWWQQEQAVLAYLIMAGNGLGPGGGAEFLARARQAASFYNAFFLDHDEGGVYFNVLANGIPYLLGTERLKGSHSMSAYHATELCYLATVYQRLLIHRDPLDLWFRPQPDGFPDRILRVAPDALPAGRVRLSLVEIDDRAYDDFDPEALTVRLPKSSRPLRVRVRLVAR